MALINQIGDQSHLPLHSIRLAMRNALDPTLVAMEYVAMFFDDIDGYAVLISRLDA